MDICFRPQWTTSASTFDFFWLIIDILDELPCIWRGEDRIDALESIHHTYLPRCNRRWVQMLAEVNAWPYTWPSSPDFAKAKDRGQVSGRLLVRDKWVIRISEVSKIVCFCNMLEKTVYFRLRDDVYQQILYRIPQNQSLLPGLISQHIQWENCRYASPDKLRSGTEAFIGLAMPGEKGSWQKESKVRMLTKRYIGTSIFRVVRFSVVIFAVPRSLSNNPSRIFPDFTLYSRCDMV